MIVALLAQDWTESIQIIFESYEASVNLYFFNADVHFGSSTGF
jgi:hypothetical protein